MKGDIDILVARYARTIRSVETQSCNCGEFLQGDAWRERGCGISYEYWNDILVRSAIASKIESGDICEEKLAEVDALDERLKRLLAANGIETHDAEFWLSGLPLGVAE